MVKPSQYLHFLLLSKRIKSNENYLHHFILNIFYQELFSESYNANIEKILCNSMSLRKLQIKKNVGFPYIFNNRKKKQAREKIL